MKWRATFSAKMRKTKDMHFVLYPVCNCVNKIKIYSKLYYYNLPLKLYFIYGSTTIFDILISGFAE